ncbi:[NiFe]-hydrogenase assembly chaperone HybE [Motiliproteus sediminis]|uniref:[NiFe]-hydrogenase assembly chaperone HybE n=1 Tax=Motiliproteus sediminis TaxID=1468178 RepID=UPI001AEFC3CA|nr:[NiFe]-hydrogenase assembly chaperone HybE [Motiliproteus sediminis]
MLAGFVDNPASRLEQVFNDIYRQRMQDVPVVNPAIRVEAVGFDEWEGHWLGVLITPWFMNLLVVPKQGAPWPEFDTAKRKGEEIALSFPQGAYNFSAREEEGIGSYLSCSLASPVHEWNNHLELRKTAQDVLRLLRTLPVVQVDEEPAKGCNLSRRNFLRGGDAVSA